MTTERSRNSRRLIFMLFKNGGGMEFCQFSRLDGKFIPAPWRGGDRFNAMATG
jgi:hypothetical protein